MAHSSTQTHTHTHTRTQRNTDRWLGVRRIWEVEEGARETERERRGSLERERRGSLGVTYRQRRSSLSSSSLSAQQPCLSPQCSALHSVHNVLQLEADMVGWNGISWRSCTFFEHGIVRRVLPQGRRQLHFRSNSPSPTHAHGHTCMQDLHTRTRVCRIW
jgi:hypothetical protein